MSIVRAMSERMFIAIDSSCNSMARTSKTDCTGAVEAEAGVDRRVFVIL